MSERVGMKETELRKLATCGGCGKGIGKGNIFFWKITIDRYAFDHNALQRQQGLGLQIGALSRVMGPDEDLAARIGPPAVFSLCQDCILKPLNLAAMEEQFTEEEAEEDKEGSMPPQTDDVIYRRREPIMMYTLEDAKLFYGYPDKRR